MMFRGRADEAFALAQAAKAEASTAVTEIRNHATFCTEREKRRDGEHATTVQSTRDIVLAVNSLRAWVVTLVLSAAGTFIFSLLGVVAWLLVHFVLAVPAAHAAAPAKTDPALAPWFQSLRNPALGISCCAEADGHILKDSEWHVAGDHYQVRINDAWQDVPSTAVVDNVSNPTGGAVVFYSPYSANPPIYCFIRPVET